MPSFDVSALWPEAEWVSWPADVRFSSISRLRILLGSAVILDTTGLNMKLEWHLFQSAEGNRGHRFMHEWSDEDTPLRLSSGQASQVSLDIPVWFQRRFDRMVHPQFVLDEDRYEGSDELPLIGRNSQPLVVGITFHPIAEILRSNISLTNFPTTLFPTQIYFENEFQQHPIPVQMAMKQPISFLTEQFRHLTFEHDGTGNITRADVSFMSIVKILFFALQPTAWNTSNTLEGNRSSMLYNCGIRDSTDPIRFANVYLDGQSIRPSQHYRGTELRSITYFSYLPNDALSSFLYALPLSCINPTRKQPSGGIDMKEFKSRVLYVEFSDWAKAMRWTVHVWGWSTNVCYGDINTQYAYLLK